MVFTGIVQITAQARFDASAHNLIVKGTPNFFSNSRSGDSVAINGVCLTLLRDPVGDEGEFFIMQETRSKTSFEFVMQDKEKSNTWFAVNVEHAMRMGDSVGGHKVLGHVDGLGSVSDMSFQPDGSCNIWIDISTAITAFNSPPVVHKGSICFDGTSLTVAELKNNSSLVRVSLIPYTLQHTIFHTRKVGDHVNVEFDHDLLITHDAVKTWEAEYKTDEYYMNKAIEVAERGRLTAAPNPWVGAVIVAKDNKSIIGEGFHRKAGEPHAEVNAVKDAREKGNGDKLAGSTVYVTLEPCHHVGRTPPCDKLLVECKVARVVIGTLDPDPRVAGEGVNYLKDNKIDVLHGVCLDKVADSLRSYLHQRKTKRPYVVVKCALSLDSKISCLDGSSKWITGPAARAQGHVLRAQSQAIMVGSRTAVLDLPILNVRDVPGAEDSKPLRVVLDTKGVVLDGPLLDVSIAPTVIFYTNKAPATSVEKWTKAGVERVEVEEDKNGRVSLDAVLENLGNRGIFQVLVEGGAELHNSLLQNNYVDELAVFYGACILGGTAQPWITSTITNTISDAKFWKLSQVQQLDNDIFALYKYLH